MIKMIPLLFGIILFSITSHAALIDRGGGLMSIISSINNVNVIAACDVLSFRLKEGLAKDNSNPIGYSDYRRLLDNKNIDAVIVATPFNTHSKIAIDALDAGKHVYCEKTLAKGYKGIGELLNKANRSYKHFLILDGRPHGRRGLPSPKRQHGCTHSKGAQPEYLTSRLVGSQMNLLYLINRR